MQREAIRFLVVALSGLVLWVLASIALGTDEPWDSPDYAQSYVAALGLCALLGFLYHERAWRWGPIVIFAQLPVMLFHAGLDPLLLAGLLFLALLSLPAILAALAGSWLKRSRRRRPGPSSSDGRGGIG